jgi:hypothetical protein
MDKTQVAEVTLSVERVRSHLDRGRLAVVLGACLVLVVYLLAVDDVVGSWSDDAHFIVLAKALASGAGYTAISSPNPKPSVLYPPGLPGVLALIFLAAQEFPSNLVLLKLVPIIGAAAFWVLSFFLLSSLGRVSTAVLGLALLVTALHPFGVWFLGSTVMSDFPYAMVSVVALMATSSYLTRDREPVVGRSLLWAGVSVAAACLVRSIGLALVVASVGYALWTRRWRKAVALGLCAVILLLPWAVFVASHSRSNAGMLDRENSLYYTYIHHLLPEARTAASADSLASSVAKRAVENLRIMALDGIPSGLFWPAYISSDRVQQQVARYPALRALQTALSLLLAVVVAIGFFTCVRRRLHLLDVYVVVYFVPVIVAPFWSPLRYLFPVLPFVTIYALMGLSVVASRLWWGRRPTLRGAVACLLILVGLAYVALNTRHIVDVRLREIPRSEFYVDWREMMESYSWVRAAVPRELSVGARNPPQFYLFALRPAFYVPTSIAEARVLKLGYLHIPCRWEPSLFEPWWQQEGLQKVFVTTRGSYCVYRVSG